MFQQHSNEDFGRIFSDKDGGLVMIKDETPRKYMTYTSERDYMLIWDLDY